MKKILMIALLAVMAAACSEDGPAPVVRDALLTFDVVSEASPENIQVFYESPDPGCGVPKFYQIYCDYKANELVLKCNNVAKIFIKKASESVYSHTSAVDYDYHVSVSDGIKAVCGYSKIVATIEDENTLRLVFEQTSPEENEGYESARLSLTLADSESPAVKYETLYIVRIFDRDIPSLYN